MRMQWENEAIVCLYTRRKWIPVIKLISELADFNALSFRVFHSYPVFSIIYKYWCSVKYATLDLMYISLLVLYYCVWRESDNEMEFLLLLSQSLYVFLWYVNKQSEHYIYTVFKKVT